MKLTERILFLLRTAWNDLFAEEGPGEPGRAASGELAVMRLNGLLDEAQRKLDALRLELANALTRQKRLAHAWQETRGQVNSLETAADEALKAGQEAQARLLLEQALPLNKDAEELAGLVKACEQHTSEIRSALNSQQEKLETLRRRARLLEDRENSLSALSELFGAQQSLTRQTESLQNELADWEEQIARREDQLAARRDLLGKAWR